MALKALYSGTLRYITVHAIFLPFFVCFSNDHLWACFAMNYLCIFQNNVRLGVYSYIVFQYLNFDYCFCYSKKVNFYSPVWFRWFCGGGFSFPLVVFYVLHWDIWFYSGLLWLLWSRSCQYVLGWTNECDSVRTILWWPAGRLHFSFRGMVSVWGCNTTIWNLIVLGRAVCWTFLQICSLLPHFQ